MIYIIDKNGRIAYKAMWTDHEEVASVLANLVLADQTGRPGCEGQTVLYRKESTTFQHNMLEAAREGL
jgi:hypothetical protein